MLAKRIKPDRRINCRRQYDRRTSRSQYKWRERRHTARRSMVNRRQMERRHTWFAERAGVAENEIDIWEFS